jgi:hypothetical protein
MSRAGEIVRGSWIRLHRGLDEQNVEADSTSPQEQTRAPVLRKARPLAPIVAVALLLWLIFPFGAPGYDTTYHLVWGRELAHGMSPDYGSPLPPTPHPLSFLWGALLTPLGAGALDATTIAANLTLGAVAYLIYRLGTLWFDRPIGLVAALIVLTRVPFLDSGLHADNVLPYIALALLALAIETRRPRAGWPVLVLLAVAGLLRPEAWLFSAGYLAYLSLERDPDLGGLALRRRAGMQGRRLAGLVALAASAPIAWAAFDLITANDPLYSFTGTRQSVEILGRQTGPDALVLYGPRSLGGVLQWPVAVGAAGGVALCVAFLRRRALIGLAAAALALAAFAILAVAGLAVIPRYTMLAAAVLSIFFAAALLGWRLLPADHRWRRRWQLFASAVLVMFVIWTPNQYDLLSTEYSDLDNQSQIENDLQALADSGAFEKGCLPISLPSHRAIPILAMFLNLRPMQIVSSSEQRRPDHGYFLDPANQFVLREFIVDPADPIRLRTQVPPGFRPVPTDNESWRLYERCRARG